MCRGVHRTAAVWVKVVTAGFVHTQARVYAERLFKTPDDERLAPQDR